MKLSIYTPTHDTRYLCDAYESLRGEDFDEWVILYNGGAKPIGWGQDDPRVKEITVAADALPPYVGALKRAAVEHCTGEVCVELDHDDLLLPGAIAAVREAFEARPDVVFVYSNDVLVNGNGTPRETWPGWRYRPVDVTMPSAMRPTPPAAYAGVGWQADSGPFDGQGAVVWRNYFEPALHGQQAVQSPAFPFPSAWPAREGFRSYETEQEALADHRRRSAHYTEAGDLGPPGVEGAAGARGPMGRPGAYIPGRHFPALETVAYEPWAFHVARIWSAPDHLRAFRRSAYDAAGGYAADMRVLDDQDLMSRLFLQGEFLHIDRPLYLYRVHGDNAWLRHNAEIQENVLRIYDQYIEGMALAWTMRRGLFALDLGGRLDPRPGYLCVDYKCGPTDRVHCVADLNKPWPFADNSVGLVRAFDVFEHLTDSVHTMTELHRVLAPGGMALIQVPSTAGTGAFRDPTHRSFWHEQTFDYFAGAQAQWIDRPTRFHMTRRYTTPADPTGCCWVRADLVKMVDGMRVYNPSMVNQ